MLLKDKVVIVSGIGPGLGVKLAVEAAREGARAVVAAARTSEKLDDAEKRIRALGTSCRVLKLPTDITDAAQCRQAAERTVKEFGRIDGLVNSAYFHGDFGPVSEPDFATWSQVLDTNLMGSVRMTLAVAPQMKKQGGGAVVMINTMTTLKPFPGEGAYAASKSALLTATKYLAMELGPVQHPRQLRPDGLDVGRARAGLHRGDRQGAGRARAAAHRRGGGEHTLAPHRHRRRVRARGVVPDFRLRLRGQRRRARCEWR